MSPSFQIYSADQLQAAFAAQTEARLKWARSATLEWPFPSYSEIPYGVPTGLRSACHNMFWPWTSTARTENSRELSLFWKHLYDAGDVTGATILSRAGRESHYQDGGDYRLITPVILRKGDGTPAADAMKGPILERIEEYFANGGTPDLDRWEESPTRREALINKLRVFREDAAVAIVAAQERLLRELISQSGNGNDPKAQSFPAGLQFRVTISGLFPSPEPEHRVRAYMEETFERHNLKLTSHWDNGGFDWIMNSHGGHSPFFDSQLHPLIEEKPLGDYRSSWSPRPLPIFTFKSGDLTGPGGLQKYQQLRVLLHDAGWRTTPAFPENIVFFTDSLQRHRAPQTQHLISKEVYAERMQHLFGAFFSKSIEHVPETGRLNASIEESMPQALMARSSGRNVAISAPNTAFFNLLAPEQQEKVRDWGSPYVFRGRATHNVCGIPEAQMGGGGKLFIGPSIINLDLPAASSLRTSATALTGIGNLLGEQMPIVQSIPPKTAHQVITRPRLR
jgi:hypothetical protein